MKQKIYKWKGYVNGLIAEGYCSAENERFAFAELESKQIVKIKLSRCWNKQQKIKKQDIIFFTRQLAMLLESGLPIIESLQIMQDTTENISLKNHIQSIRENLELGKSFSFALLKLENMFDPLCVQLIKIGEQTGYLELVLKRVSDYYERMMILEVKIRKVFFYPACVLTISVLVMIVLLIFVIPQFELLYSGFNASLPALTYWTIFIARKLKQIIPIAFIFTIALTALFKYFYKNHKNFRGKLDFIILKIPLIGDMIKTAIFSRIAYAIAIGLKAGVPLLEVIASLKSLSGNVHFEAAIVDILNNIKNGISLFESMRRTGLFPNVFLQIVRTGEASGKLDGMLEKITVYYEEKIDLLISQLDKWLEPAIMVVLGVAVGTLLVAMYLPIFQLGTIV